jgi:hypothetical protein
MLWSGREVPKSCRRGLYPDFVPNFFAAVQPLHFAFVDNSN